MITDDTSLEIAKAAAEGVGKESVNKLVEIIGNFFPFFDSKRQAVTTYIEDIKNSNLPAESKMIAISNVKQTFKQLKNQYSIAKIAQDVAQKGTDFSQSSSVDDEWLERFMDSAKFVSDEAVQTLWGNVLAKEFEKPNSTPPSVIRILTEITPACAKAFKVVCSLMIGFLPMGQAGTFKSGVENIIILPPNYVYLNDLGITFNMLNELQTIGLIQFDPVIGYMLEFDKTIFPTIHIIYGQDTATITTYKNKQLPSGVVIFTHAGRALSRFTEKKIIEGHFSAVYEYLKSNDVKFSDTPQIRVENNNT